MFVLRKIGFVAMSPPDMAGSLAVQGEVSVEGKWQEHRVWGAAGHGTSFKLLLRQLHPRPLR